MDNVLNKTLAVLVVSIVVSSAGTLVGIERLDLLRLGLYATGGGTVGNITINILQAVTANLTDDAVRFEAGNVHAGQPYAYIDTNGNNTNWNGAATQDGMEVRNEGNTAINVTIQTSKNSSEFLCEGQNYLVNCGVNQSFPPNFSFWAEQNESNASLGDVGSCGSGPTESGTFFRGGNRTVPRELLRNGSTVPEFVTCENLSSTDGTDSFVLEFAVTIPSDATGVKNNTITITARQTS